MRRLLSKTAVIAPLILGAMLQGWPLLVAAVCSMPGDQLTKSAEACCCCSDFQNIGAPAYSSCNPGKTLAGVLSTAPSLQPKKDNKAKNTLTLTPALVHAVVDVARDPLSSASSFCFDQAVFACIASPPLYLLDSVFRI